MQTGIKIAFPAENLYTKKVRKKMYEAMHACFCERTACTARTRRNFMQDMQENEAVRPESDMGVGSWIGTLIVAAIPIVGLIMLIVWAVSGHNRPSRRNWAIAQLILSIICYVIAIVLLVTMSSTFSAMMQL
jgi:hypothetical protein